MIGLFCTILAVYYFWTDDKKYFSVLLILFLVTGGFQLIPNDLLILPQLGLQRTYDWLLIFCFLIFFIKPTIFINAELWSSNKYLKYFGLYLLLLLLFNSVYLNIDLSTSLKVFRSYIYFIVVFPFVALEKEDYSKIFYTLIYVTSFASLLYSLQPIVGNSILQTQSEFSFYEEGGMIRYYNLPFFIVPVIFFLFFDTTTSGVKYKNVLLTVNCLAILLSQHRNYLLSVIVCFTLYIWLSEKIKPSHILVYALIGLAVLIGIDNYFNNRLSKGVTELSETGVSSSDPTKQTTTEFRKQHFLERFDFVKQEATTLLFGVGLLSEDAHQVQHLSFNIGAENEYGEIMQIYTDDIAWSMILLQLGLVGIFLILLIHYSFFVSFFKEKTDIVMMVGVLYIIFLILTSFYGSLIIMPYTVCLLMLFFSYRFNLKKVEKEWDH